MVYKYKSSKEIIGSLYDEGVKTSDWEGRIAAWCLKAIKGLNCIKTKWDVSSTTKINDYKIIIPDTIDEIQSISIGKNKFYEIRKTRPIEREETNYLQNYQILNGEIRFAITDTEVTINARVYPISFDAETRTHFPLFPDLEEVEEYLKLYCLRRIILRGYVHPMYSFNILNNKTNINVLTDEAKRKARFAINAMNNEQRRRVSDIMVRMDTSPNIDTNYLFL